MPLTLQILRKDVERLWPAVLLTLILLVYWTFQESTHVTFNLASPVPQNGWLNLALPSAWSLLIALAIHQDPLAGDRQFWVSLPCGWRPLIAAKAAFILAFIQIPYLLATAIILFARGFNAFGYIPHLFWKQLVLLGLILPAVAVATVAKNTAQFLLVLIALASSLVFLSSRINFRNGPANSWDVRWDLALLVLCIGALIVTLLQFATRYTTRARAIGLIAALAAAGLYNWLPRDASAGISAALHPAPAGQPRLSMQLSGQSLDPAMARRYYNFQRNTLLLPYTFPGSPPDRIIRFEQISFELIRANGERYEAQWPISVYLNDIDPTGHMVQEVEFYNAAIWNKLRSGPVTVHGRIFAEFDRAGTRTTVTEGVRTEVSGLGFCVTGFQGMMSTIGCESPEVNPREMRAEITAGGNVYPAYMTARLFFGWSPYPEDPWLSPLHRGSTLNSSGTVFSSVTPMFQVGSAVIEYTFPNIDLNRFLLPAPTRQEAPK
jgi:hypothetical protein